MPMKVGAPFPHTFGFCFLALSGLIALDGYPKDTGYMEAGKLVVLLALESDLGDI